VMRVLIKSGMQKISNAYFAEYRSAESCGTTYKMRNVMSNTSTANVALFMTDCLLLCLKQ